jgi:AbiJ N-terminal domain 4
LNRSCNTASCLTLLCWSEYPNVDNEVRRLIGGCKWYKVYDVVEKLYSHLLAESNTREARQKADIFQKEINEYFLEMGIGWKLVDGQIEIRGTEAFEEIVKTAKKQLQLNDRHITASKELHEAICDLSRRPSADTTGAIQHAMASLECVAREITGERTLTLGRIMERNKNIIPSPLNIAIEKSWGYASEHGRHLQEDREPAFEEAELIVGICASIGNYLAKKYKDNELSE